MERQGRTDKAGRSVKDTIPTLSAPTPARRGPRLRSLFVSDLHLGNSGARAVEFLEFLRETEADAIYLVGDIFDIWHVGRVHWSATHDAILQDLATRAATGTRVVYLPGNHDAAMRNFVGIASQMFLSGGFDLQDSFPHIAADGRRYLVLHGDQCDSRLFKWHVFTRLGSRLEAVLRRVDRVLLRATGSAAQRGFLDLLRRGVNALALAGNGFEQRLVRLARDGAHDGVICGHFHRPALRDHGGTTYANCGDWVDSLTALVETEDGALRLVEWAPVPQENARAAAECVA